MTAHTPRFGGVHHVALIVANTERALAFYRDVLGLDVAPQRPALPYPGAWLQIGGQQLHLMELPNPDPTTSRPIHGGRDRHVALYVDDVDALDARLEAAGCPVTRSRSGRRALFFRDPDGNAIECMESSGSD
jgi:glyoxylase I family protein